MIKVNHPPLMSMAVKRTDKTIMGGGRL
jgi:hypothetical protein